jgi:hypothetical protein
MVDSPEYYYGDGREVTRKKSKMTTTKKQFLFFAAEAPAITASRHVQTPRQHIHYLRFAVVSKLRRQLAAGAFGKAALDPDVGNSIRAPRSMTGWH